MKYRFVWDKDFLGNQMFELSEEEMTIVIAIIVGGHNAIFSGYNTERLVNAVKTLRDINTPFVSVENPIDYKELIGDYSDRGLKQGFVTDADKGFLHISDLYSQNSETTSWLLTVMGNGWIKLCHSWDTVTLPASFQLLAETQDINTRDWGFSRIVDNCDIRYNCKRNTERNLYSVSALRGKIRRVKEYQDGFERVISNSKIGNVCEIRPTSEASIKIREENISTDTARLGRTLADINGHYATFCSDLRKALSYQNICG